MLHSLAVRVRVGWAEYVPEDREEEESRRSQRVWRRQLGNPVVVWRDGCVVRIPAEKIPVELTIPLPEME